MTQALPRPVDRSRLRSERRAYVRRARARIFRGRNHAAAVVALTLVVIAGFRAFPGRDVLVVSDAGAQVYHTVFPGEVWSLPGLDPPEAGRPRTFASTGLAGIGLPRTRDVTMMVDGREFLLRTSAATIGGALASAGVELGPRDRVRLNGAVATPGTPLSGVRLTSASAQDINTVGRPRIEVERARRYVIYIDAMRVDVQSSAATVGELVADLGLIVREADLVEPPMDTPLTAGMAVRLAPARTVTVVLDGQAQSLYTRAATVSEVLVLLDLQGAQVVELSHARDAYLPAGSTLVVGTLRTVREEVIEPLPPTTLVEEDPSLPRGHVRLITGRPGEVRTVVEAVYRNGVLESRTVVSQAVTRAPVANRQVVGTRDADAPGLFLASPEYTGPYRKKLAVWATWYNASHGPWAPGDPAYGRTATGVIVDRGICAVDPQVIPLGTRFVVPGYGLCVAADVGGGIKGAKIDLGFPEDAGPNPWRTGTVDIYILD
ncbi:MAG: ubiquitin-like domain-containing protein [Dehalococcoidia bacterium]|nr:ubiquitin-like domain-containing protein [Dehalococcoidia bacterium]